MTGYWKPPEATSEAVIDGWYRTGDAAFRDQEGYVTIVDRLKDMIVTGGENVYSAEVEAVLSTDPAVLEVAVIGVPDPRWGEAVKAIVVPKPGAARDAEPILARLRGHLAGYKIPKSIDFADALPRTRSGKILKRVLRAPYRHPGSAWHPHARRRQDPPRRRLSAGRLHRVRAVPGRTRQGGLRDLRERNREANPHGVIGMAGTNPRPAQSTAPAKRSKRRVGRPSIAHDRRPQIVEAFAGCIRDHGLSGATMERVAERLGVSRTLIFHYFRNTDALVRAVVRHWWRST